MKIRTSSNDKRSDHRGQWERATTAEATTEMQHGQQQRRQQYDVTKRVQSLRRFMPIYTIPTNNASINHQTD